MQGFVQRQYAELDFWQSNLLCAAGIPHGFIGADLDARSAQSAAVLEQFFGSETPCVLLQQVHGTRLCAAAEATASESPEADGSYYFNAELNSGPALGILTADCAPVLLASQCRRFYAALHCGWRGTAAGLLSEAVGCAGNYGVSAGELLCCIGPAAGACCYEVGPEFVEYFASWRNEIDFFEHCFPVRNARQYFNNSRFLLLQAESLGIRPESCSSFPGCTICDEAFFSYRRQKADAGRQLSFIGGPASLSFV